MSRFLPVFIAVFQLTDIVCLAQNTNLPKNGQRVDFFKEEITLTVSDSAASVSGVYYFRSNSNNFHSFVVQFPFYVDSLSLYPDTIAAYALDNGIRKPLKVIPIKAKNSVALSIPLEPEGITTWQLDYTQKIRSPRARYILTSTAAWNNPLDSATYTFVVPASFDSVRTWPAADTVIIEGKFKEYISRKTNFMPHQNMEIYWIPDNTPKIGKE